MMFKRLFLLIAIILLAVICAQVGAVVCEADLKARIETASKDFKDFSATAVVLEKDTKALAKIEPAYAQIYDLKSTTLFVKLPGKIRTEGKLGMVKFEYIINGTMKTFRASSPIKINKRKDYAADPAKLQYPLDLGLVTPQLWLNRISQIVDDPEADKNGEIKIKLQWPKSKKSWYVWLDAANLYLKRMEKYEEDGKMQISMIYTNPQKVGEVFWVPTKMEMRNAENQKIAVTEYQNMKINSGLADSIFE